jgi:hypothetical protein
MPKIKRSLKKHRLLAGVFLKTAWPTGLFSGRWPAPYDAFLRQIVQDDAVIYIAWFMGFLITFCRFGCY